MNLKQLFVVSNQREIWKKGLLNAFIVEPYIHHKIQQDNSVENFHSIDVAPRRRNTQRDLERDNAYINQKYQLYIKILATRLNVIHHTDFDEKFWKKSLSIGFLRYITFAHDAFANYELYFQPSNHDCNVLDPNSFVIPIDYEEQMALLMYEDLAYEQLFSTYIHLYYPEKFSTITLMKDSPSNNMNQKVVKLTTWLKLVRQIKRIKELNLKRILLRLCKKGFSKNIKVGIYGAYFTQSHTDDLRWKSKCKVNVIPKVGISFPKKIQLDDGARKYISKFSGGFDRFDKFFFKSMETLFPFALVENFEKISNEICNHFSPYTSLQYIICESWMSSTLESISLAYLQQKDIKHIYNEHNSLFHQYSGTMIEHRSQLSDIYYSMGWSSKNIPNLVQGASLFEFSIKKPKKTKYQVTFVSNNRFAKIPEYTSAYGFCAEGVDKYASFMLDFLSSLSKDVKKKMLYRGLRPGDSYGMTYNIEFLLKPYISELLHEDTSDFTGKELIAASGLVVFDYIATSFLESMHMNVPTVLLLNKNIYYLKDEHLGFFDDLIEVGICQTSSQEAAIFIESIAGNADTWWHNEQVQEARSRFLEKNFGTPNNAINYYCNLLK